MTVLLAHAGEGATWQALLTVMSAGLVVVFVLAIIGRISVETPGDLTLPIAAVAVLASLAPVGGDALSDLAPWAVPAGVVVLVALVVAAVRGVRLQPRSRFVVGTLALAIVAALAVAPTLVDAWYPPEAQQAATLES